MEERLSDEAKKWIGDLEQLLAAYQRPRSLLQQERISVAMSYRCSQLEQAGYRSVAVQYRQRIIACIGDDS